MSTTGKVFSTLLVLIVLVVGAAAIFVATFDINQYRDQIADALSKQTGRTVKFGGPIKLAFSQHGIGVAVENASISNAPWGSKPVMASIGKLQLGVGLMPLIDRKVVITELDIRNADIQLETNASNEHNWDMKPAGGPAAAAAPQPATPAGKTASAAPSVGVSVQQLSITDSQIAMRDKDGKTSTFKVEKMTLAPESRGVAVSLSADYNGTPIKIALKTGASDLMAEAKWPYDADLTYGNYHLNAQGNADTTAKKFDLNPYELAAGGSSLHGQIMADFGGAKPELRGSIMGDKLDPADFKPPSSGTEATPNSPAANNLPASTEGKQPMFSAAPLDLSALKSANATIDIAIGEVALGKTALKQVTGKVALTGGNLTISPFKASLGESPMQGEVKLNATSPAQYSVSFKAPGVDLATLLQMAGTNPFLTGKGDADIELSGSGNSLHEMAASSAGHINVTAAGGTISASEAGSVASGLAQIFAPGQGNPTLNCAAARFNVTGGVGKDNGILADSSASTVGGVGGFNLGGETLDLTLTAKPKLGNMGITPAVVISGPLNGPAISLDTANVAQNVAGTLLKNNKTAGIISGVLNGGNNGANGPVLALAADVPQGQNACLYTLDHKPATSAAAPAPAGNNAVKDVTSKTTGKAKDMGKQLLQGIMGH